MKSQVFGNRGNREQTLRYPRFVPVSFKVKCGLSPFYVERLRNLHW